MLEWFLKNKMRFLVGLISAIIICSIVRLQFPANQLLSDEELERLISDKGIEPVLISNIGDSYTAILYKDDNRIERLMLIAYKNIWSTVKTKPFAFYTPDRASKVNVEYWSKDPFRYNLIGFVGIEILNKEVFDKAKSVKVVLDNGVVERAYFNNSNILLVPATRKYFWEKPRIEIIELYDDNGKVIDGFYTRSEYLPD